MLRMDGFAYHHATTPEEAVRLWHSHEDATYIAGGTDLLPNLKHRIVAPQHLVGIATALPAGWEEKGRDILIGAGTTLSALSRIPLIPPLATAAGLVAGPQIRNMGTIGGNVLLDTRCLFYNQSAFWRHSLGWCLKAEGDWCHVIDGPKTCVAIQSSDTVPVLLAMDASIRLLNPGGERILRLRELFQFDGMNHLKIEPGELLTHVIVPKLAPAFRGSYQKLRARDSIDFPQLGLAIAAEIEGTGPTAILHRLDLVVGATNPAPKPVRKLESFVGQALNDEAITAIGDLVHRQTRPQEAVHGDSGWRRHMARVFTTRGLHALREELR